MDIHTLVLVHVCFIQTEQVFILRLEFQFKTSKEGNLVQFLYLVTYKKYVSIKNDRWRFQTLRFKNHYKA